MSRIPASLADHLGQPKIAAGRSGWNRALAFKWVEREAGLGQTTGHSDRLGGIPPAVGKGCKVQGAQVGKPRPFIPGVPADQTGQGHLAGKRPDINFLGAPLGQGRRQPRADGIHQAPGESEPWGRGSIFPARSLGGLLTAGSKRPSWALSHLGLPGLPRPCGHFLLSPGSFCGSDGLIWGETPRGVRRQPWGALNGDTPFGRARDPYQAGPHKGLVRGPNPGATRRGVAKRVAAGDPCGSWGQLLPGPRGRTEFPFKEEPGPQRTEPSRARISPEQGQSRAGPVGPSGPGR